VTGVAASAASTTVTERRPLVSVVIVNFNGADMLGDVLDSVRAQSLSCQEIVVVDNGSADGSCELVRRAYPEVRLLVLDENLGFAGGNNAGIRAAKGEYVALINNDAVADRHWLEELVNTAEKELEVAAVGSKILFFKPFIPIHFQIEQPTAEAGVLDPDPCEPGFLLCEDCAVGGCSYSKPVFREGFHAAHQVEGRRVLKSEKEATCYLPIDTIDEDVRLRLTVAGAEEATDERLLINVGSFRVGAVKLEAEFREYQIELTRAVLAEESFDVINNAGTLLSSFGDAADRGIYEPDRGQYDRAEDVDAFCGASVLLRRSALEDVGLLDSDFYMYYEDTDLSWRLRSRGYRIYYQPRSVVRHRHAASSVEWSPMFTFHTARNRVLMILKNGGIAAIARVGYSELRCMTSMLRQAWSLRGGHDALRVRGELTARIRAHRSLLRLTPRAVFKRLGAIPHSTARGRSEQR
jgi:GT2 family glycosyltransferase